MQLSQGDTTLTFAGNAFNLSQDVTLTGNGHSLDLTAQNVDDSHPAFRFAYGATFSDFSNLTFTGAGDALQTWVQSPRNTTNTVSLGTQDGKIGNLVLENLNISSWGTGSRLDIYAGTLDASTSDIIVNHTVTVHATGEGQSSQLRKLQVNNSGTFTVEGGSVTVAGTVVNQGKMQLGSADASLTSVDLQGDFSANTKSSLDLHAENVSTKKLTINNESSVTLNAASTATIDGAISLNASTLALQSDTITVNGQLINKTGTATVTGQKLNLNYAKTTGWDGALVASDGGTTSVTVDNLTATGAIGALKMSSITIDAQHTDLTFTGTGQAINANDNSTIAFSSTAADTSLKITAEKGSAVLTSNNGTFSVAGGSVNITGTVQANEGGVVTLGTQDQKLENITLTGATGPLLRSNGGSVSVAAKKVSITNANGNAVEVFNLARDASAKTGSMSIYADNDLRISGDVVSGVDGNATGDERKVSADTSLTIGGAKDTAIVIDGDVTSYNTGDDSTANKVTINLTNDKSSLHGAILNQNLAGEAVTAGGTSLGLTGNAQWQVTGDSNVSDITSAGGHIDLASGKVTVGTLTNGAGGTLVTTDKTEAGQLVIGTNKGDDLKVQISGTGTDTLTGNADTDEETLKNLVSIGKTDAGYEIDAQEGTVIGSSQLIVNADGTMTFTEQANTVTAGLEDIASSNFLAFRAQTNDLQKRMGDLRTMPKTDGAWARYFGGKNKYGDRSMKNRYDSVQIGVDHRFTEQFLAGLTFGYTKNDGTLVNGTSDIDNYNFGVYGSWLGDDGQFVDVTFKRHRLDTNYDLTNTSGLRHTGSYDTWGTSLSVEYGWRLGLGQTAFYIEPQVEFTLGRLDSASYTTSAGSSVEQKAIETYVGRIGAAAGYVFPNNAGSVYVKASLLHDWAGSLDGEVSYKGQRRSFATELGGTWGEFAAGGSYNVTNRLSVYGEVQTTTGSPVDNPWQASVGVRWSF